MKITNNTNWFSVTGRVRRLTYWMKFLISRFLVIAAICGACLSMDCWPGQELRPLWIGVLVVTVVFVTLFFETAMITVKVRRFHDRDMSGWWVLWFCLLKLVPILGLVVLVAEWIILGFLDGTHGDNRYGPNPKGACD